MKLYPSSTECKATTQVADAAIQNNNADKAPSHRLTVRVKELCERDRRRILMHFLALSESDRLLRFGSILPDEAVTRYVQRLDFSRDKIFGVLDNNFQLVGVGHLAFMLRDAQPVLNAVTRKERVGEFGVSVSESARGIGAGTQLFKRAAIHCRNADIDVLIMQCLATNTKMIRIARNAGMEIQREYGEADAYLRLAPADTASVLREAVDEQVASIDYSIKANMRAASKWLDTLQGVKAG